MWDIGVPGVVLGQYDVVWNQKGRGEKGRRAREKKLDGKGGPFPKYYALGKVLLLSSTCCSLPRQQLFQPTTSSPLAFGSWLLHPNPNP